MSADKLKLEVIMGLVEKVTGPLKNITKGSSTTAKALKAARDELKQLNDAQNRADGWRKTSKDVSVVGNQLKAARQHLKNVKSAMAETTVPTRDMQRALKDAQQQVNTYGMRLSGLIDKKKRLHTEMVTNGVDLKNLKRYQGDLAGQIDKATAAVDKQVAAMQRQNAVAQRRHAAMADYQKATAIGGRMTGAGRTAMGAGVAAGAPIVLAIRQYASFEDAMLGVARQVGGARDANGQLTATYYEIGDAIKAMGDRIPLANADLAEILAMGARMGIQGKADLLKFTETAAVMADAFNISADDAGDTIAKLSQLYRVPIKDIGALGDAINWLDDNTVSKGADIIQVMQEIAGMTTTLNMSYKEAAALGSTFLSLGQNASTAASASEAMLRQLAAATMQPGRFKTGMQMLGLDPKAIQDAMTTDAMGTLMRVMEAIKRMPENQRIEVATRLFGREYGGAASKLAGNLDELQKQMGLVNDQMAKGSMQREAAARAANLSSRYIMLKNTLGTTAAEIGATLKPALVDLMHSGAELLQGVRDWMKENPGLTSALVKIAAVSALVVTAIGAIVFAIGALIGPIALLKLSFAYMGLGAGGAVTGLLGFLNPVAKVVAAFSAGYAIGTLINGWLDGFISKIFGYKTTLGGAIFDIVQLFKNGEWSAIGTLMLRGIIAGLDALTGGLYSKMAALAAKFVSIGASVGDGIWTGLKNGWGKIVSGIKSLAALLPAGVRTVLGIRSPSTVFNAIGRYTMDGLSGGIDAGRKSAVSAAANAARKVAAAGAGMLIGGAAMAAPAIDNRPALSGPGGGAAAGGGNTFIFQIHAAPGMDEEALARAVERKFRQIEAQRAARGRSRLSDKE